MPRWIEKPTIITAAGNKPKQIEEYVGRVNTGREHISVARMISPGGWIEPAQQPEFEEITVVLKGTLVVECADERFEVKAGEGIITSPGEKVRYSTPGDEGAEYIAICLPAFSPATVHRIDE
ncbi:MAG: cupin domain-containing protein [Planctomycetota bacterium]|nr:cupin domain-containing protein [Planctomycetota bacterium]